MPRALWSGSLSFGLVNVPVALVPATRDRDVKLREINRRTGAPLRLRRICTAESIEVQTEDIAHGVDVDGQLVMLTDEELRDAQPRRTDTVEIGSFVDSRQIDPVLYHRSYWAVPSGTAEGPLRAYRLLVQAMDAADKAGIGETVIHGREHPVAIRALQERLLLSTLLFSAEVRSVQDLGIPKATADEGAITRAVAVVQELSTDFEPSRYRDRHRERLQALIEGKRRGERIVRPPEPAEPPATPDLMDALEQSLAEIRARGGATRRRGRSQRSQPPAPRRTGPSP